MPEELPNEKKPKRPYQTVNMPVKVWRYLHKIRGNHPEKIKSIPGATIFIIKENIRLKHKLKELSQKEIIQSTNT